MPVNRILKISTCSWQYNIVGIDQWFWSLFWGSPAALPKEMDVLSYTAIDALFTARPIWSGGQSPFSIRRADTGPAHARRQLQQRDSRVGHRRRGQRQQPLGSRVWNPGGDQVRVPAPGLPAARQRRAEAVLRALRVYGVNSSQMEAVSWGENRPKAPGQDEAAWAQNRRADLQYPTK